MDENDDLRRMLRGALVSAEPDHRDLIGPAVTIVRRRKRRVRTLGAVGSGIVVTAGAVVAVAFGGTGSGHQPLPATASTPTVSASPSRLQGQVAAWDKEHDIRDRVPVLLAPLLPQGLSIAKGDGILSGPVFRLTGPSGTNDISLLADSSGSRDHAMEVGCVAGGTCSHRDVPGGTLYVQTKNFTADYGGAHLYAPGTGKLVVSIDDEYEFVPSDSHGYVVALRISAHVAHEQYLAAPPKDYYDPAGWPPKDDPRDAFNPGGALISQDDFLALVAKPGFAEVAAVLDPTTPAAASATDKRHAADDTIAAAVKPLLPDGMTLTIDPNDFMAGGLILSGPSGTNKFQWYASPQQKNWQPGWACEVHTEKECTYTVVPGGIVQVEHQGDAIANTAPDAKTAYQPGSDKIPTNYRDVFRYLPNDPNGTILQIELDEQVRDIPWAATKPTTGPYADSPSWPPPGRDPNTAFNPNGPLLTPDQFAAIARTPGITGIVQTVNLALDPAFGPR